MRSMGVHQEKDHFQCNSVPLFGSHPFEFDWAQADLVMSIRVISPCTCLPEIG